MNTTGIRVLIKKLEDKLNNPTGNKHKIVELRAKIAELKQIEQEWERLKQ